MVTNLNFKETEIMKIDLHNMNLWQATLYLTNAVSEAPKEIKEVIVIHGYNSGVKLKNMVRNDFENNRVKRKFVSLNEGVTSLILR